jgi:excisionase family DNA binding protein
MKKETFTTTEAAAALGVSAPRVRQMVLDGSLPASRFGRALVITAEAIETARQRKTSPGPAAKSKAEAASNGTYKPETASKKRGKK